MITVTVLNQLVIATLRLPLRSYTPPFSRGGCWADQGSVWEGGVLCGSHSSTSTSCCCQDQEKDRESTSGHAPAASVGGAVCGRDLCCSKHTVVTWSCVSVLLKFSMQIWSKFWFERYKLWSFFKFLNGWLIKIEFWFSALTSVLFLTLLFTAGSHWSREKCETQAT